MIPELSMQCFQSIIVPTLIGTVDDNGDNADYDAFPINYCPYVNRNHLSKFLSSNLVYVSNQLLSLR